MKRMIFERLNKRYLYIPVALVFLSGCVYYNTFFMAKKKFNEAEESQRKNRELREEQEFGSSKGNQPVGQGRQNPGNTNRGGRTFGNNTIQTKANPQEKNLYDDAIKKASKVLANHPNSKWVDDALWLIGKSYYNMGDYSSAERKFKELSTNHPESKFADDSYFYLGLCQIELDNDDAARESFDKLAITFPKSDYIDEITYAKGALALDQDRYDDAIELFKTYLKKYPKDDSAASSQYNIGQCYENTGDYQNAFAAYSAVKKYNPSRKLEFESALAAGSVMLKTDSIAVGMKILSGLAKDDRYYSHLSKIKLKIGEGYRLEGQIDKAIEEYKGITDEDSKSLESAEAYFKLGLIYQNDLFDIEQAKAAFTKAQSENMGSEYRSLALSRSAQIAKFEAYRLQLQQVDSVRTIVDLINRMGGLKGDIENNSTVDSATVENAPPESVDDSTLEETVPEPPILPDSGDNAAIVSIDSSEVNIIPDTLVVGPNFQVPDTSIAEEPDSTSIPDDLYTVMPDSLTANDTLTAEISDSLNTGDSLKVAGDIPANTMTGDRTDQLKNNMQAYQDSIRAASQAKEERDDSIRQAILTTGIETRFLLAELYAYELNQPDSALNEYMLIVKQYPDTPFASKSLLAAANLRFNAGDSSTAKQYLNKLVDNYPHSPQASVAAEILNYPLDYSSNALGIYATAESLATDGRNPDSAAALFGYIVEKFPDLAPKAAFARAWALDLARNGADSSAYLAYQAVSVDYPQTPYGEAAAERIGKKSSVNKPPPKNIPRNNGNQPGNQPDTTTKTIGGLAMAPPVKVPGIFEYPQSLLDRRLKGQVLFKIKINLFGKIDQYEIIGPSGEHAIDSSATVALLETEFDTSNLDLAELNNFFQYAIPFERPDINNMFNDPYLPERRDGP